MSAPISSFLLDRHPIKLLGVVFFLGLGAYAVASGDTILAVVSFLAAVFLLTFGIKVTLDKKRLVVRAWGLPVVNRPTTDIREVFTPEYVGPLEKATSGIHLMGDALAVHSGAGNLAFKLKGGRIIRVTVRDPKPFLRFAEGQLLTPAG